MYDYLSQLLILHIICQIAINGRKLEESADLWNREGVDLTAIQFGGSLKIKEIPTK